MNHQNASKASGAGFSSTNFFQGQQGDRPIRNGPKTRGNSGQNRPSNRPYIKQNNGNGPPSGPRSFNNVSNPNRNGPNGPNGPRKSQHHGKPPQRQQQQQQQQQQLKPNIKQKEPVQPVKAGGFKSKFMGALLEDPTQLGFVQLSHRKRPTPKYLLKEQVLFDSSLFVDNGWDVKNQEMLRVRELQFQGDAQLLFEEFQEYRKKEREMMESLNFVDKENAKKSLNDAIIFRGSCKDMCPTYERVERVFKNQVSKWEKDPQTGKISRNFALKSFMRPSGQAPSLPSDVRPPSVLQMSLNYIIDNLLPNIKECQSFIWDRTRSIRQDFTFQNNYSGFESIDCHEKICRIHILSLHVMAGANDPDYQQQQELEQFNNSLKTLVNMYDDVKMRGGSCPNEPEFRAYEIIVKLKDFELERSIQHLPTHILNDQIVQRSLMLRGLINHGIGGLNLYSEFFKTVLDPSKTPFLLACLAEIHFNEIRYNALRQLSRLYHTKAKKTPPVEYITKVLGFDSLESLQNTCNVYNIEVTTDDEGINRLNLSSLKSVYKPAQKQAYTLQIDNMIGGRTVQQIVNSGALNVELKLSEPISDVELARQSFKESSINTKLINQTFSNQKVVAMKHMNLSQKKPTGSKLMTVESLTNNNNNNNNNNNQPVFNVSIGQQQQQQPNIGNAPPGHSGQTQPSSAFGNTTMSAFSSIGSNKLPSEPVKGNNVSTSFTFNPPLKATSAFSPSINTSSNLSLPVNQPSTFNQQNNPLAPITNEFNTNTSQSQSVKNEPKSAFGFPSTEQAPSSQSFNVPLEIEEKGSSLLNAPPLDTTPQLKPPPIVKLEPVEMKKKLIDNPEFNSAVKEEVNILLDDVLNKKMEKIVNCQLENEIMKRKRNKEAIDRQNLIKNLSNELFNAFMNEQIYLNTLEGKAKFMNEMNTKKFAIKLLKKSAQKSIEKYKIKEDKLDEINEFNNSIVVMNKPINSSFLNLPISKSNSRNSSISFSTQGINDQITKIFNKVKPERDFYASLILRDQFCPVSEWVSQYLNFILPTQQISTIVSDNDNGLIIKKLPDNFEARTYFNNVNLIILQVGSVPSDENGFLIESLKRDSIVINKLVNYLKKYSKFKFFGIVIAYVDNFNEKIPINEVIDYLGLKSVKSANISIGVIDLTDLGSDPMIGTNLNLLSKKCKMFNQVMERVFKKVIEGEKNLIENSILLDTTLTNNNTIIGKSFVELVQPMNKELLKRYTDKRNDRLSEILNATKVKKRRLAPFDSRNTTLDLRNVSMISTPGSNNLELDELNNLADSILKE